MHLHHNKQVEGLQDCSTEATPDQRNGEDNNEVAMNLRPLQKPMKEQCRKATSASLMHSPGEGIKTEIPVAYSVDIGRAIYQAEVHKWSEIFCLGHLRFIEERRIADNDSELAPRIGTD
jgi:hypothetical protein